MAGSAHRHADIPALLDDGFQGVRRLPSACQQRQEGIDMAGGVASARHRGARAGAAEAAGFR
ncbi:MAG TPA: hypothetical protein PKY22_03370 [Accumulibacter sp.]|nr:hypothetical protein [Accumulibacter sp.]